MKVEPTHLPLHAKLASRWHARRTYGVSACASISDLAEIKRAQGATISVGIPTLNEGETIGDICSVISRELMDRAGLVDELVVLDGDSTDDTARRASAAGARVIDVSEIMTDTPYRAGKGESLWRSLAELKGDIVVWVDGDIRNFGSHFVSRLVSPLLTDPSIDFVKGFYRRPIDLGTGLMPVGGGRVTELLARPMLNSLFPELAGLNQPLAGEYAGRASVLRSIPFFTGYSVEVGILIDLLDQIGLDGIAQADLGSRVHRNRPLAELGPMAFQISRTIMQRAAERGRVGSLHDIADNPLLSFDPDGQMSATMTPEIERPPMRRSIGSIDLTGEDLFDAAL